MSGRGGETFYPVLSLDSFGRSLTPSPALESLRRERQTILALEFI
jgi:hypothetical protein